MSEQDLLEYLDGEMTDPVRIAEVEAWIGKSKENREMAENMYYVLHSAKSLHVLEHTDTRKAFERFQKEVGRKRTKTFFMKIVRTFEKTAAVLILPVCIALGYLFFSGDDYGNQTIQISSKSGMVTKVELPDGTLAWLNSSSTLKYPIKFEGKQRKVELSGQAYFDVAKDKKRPFVVDTKYHYSVTALGTEFDLFASENDECIETTLVEGLVCIDFNDSKRKFSQIIHPDERLRFNARTGEMVVDQVNADNKTAWRKNRFVFRETPIEEVLMELERFYNVEFCIADEDIREVSITGTFENEQLYQILDYICMAGDMQYQLSKTEGNDCSGHRNVIVIK